MKIIKTSLKGYQNKVGVHLINPTPWRLERGIEDAEKDNFPAVYCHYSPTFKKYLDLIQSNKTWTLSDINGFRKAIGYCSSLDSETRLDLVELFQSKDSYRITKEQSDFGIKYLRGVAFKLDGSVRNTKDFPFGDIEIHVLRTFKRFEFVGLEPQQNRMGDVLSYLPIYRCISKDGSYFEYSAGMWGNLSVVGIQDRRSEIAPNRARSRLSIVARLSLNDDAC